MRPGTSIILLLLCAGFLALNVMMPRFADDFCRASTEVDLPEIAAGIYTVFFDWTGRVIVMLINRLVFSSGEIGLAICAVINSAVFTAAGVLGVLCARGEDANEGARDVELVALAIFICLLWFTPQVMGEVLLWKSGAIQYLWGTVLAVALLAPLLLPSVPLPAGRIALTGYCIAAFVAGNWLENLSLAFAVAWLILLLTCLRRGGRAGVPRALWLGWICWCLGAALLFAAPGNYERAGGMNDGLGVLERVPHTLAWLPEVVDVRTLTLLLLFLVLQMYGPVEGRQTRIRASFFFAGAGLLATLVMAGAPIHGFVRRVGFPTELLLIFAVMALFPAHLLSDVDARARTIVRGIKGGALAAAGIVAIDLLLVVPAYYQVSQQEASRARWLATARELDLPSVELLPLMLPDGRTTLAGQINEGRYFARDITQDPTHWKNTCYARAQGVRSVYLVSLD